MTAAYGLVEEPTDTAAGPRPGVEELFATYVDFIWRCMRQLGVREADLEDLTQEVFLVAYRRHATWDGEHARAWLYAIARRCAAGYRRRGHYRLELAYDEVPESGTHSDPAMKIDADRLDRALATLDEAKRDVFVLFEIEEMSMRDVAEAVGCPVQTAYARLYAARRELTRALSEER